MSKYDEALQVYAALQGFDIQGFDRWLPSLQGYGAFVELTERRQAALEAMLANDESTALRHMEWMLLQWRRIDRGDKSAAAKKRALINASSIGAAKRKETAAEQQEKADKWFSLAWVRNPHAGRDLLLTKAKQLIDADMASADKDMSRYAQAKNEDAEKLASSHKSKLRNEKDLLTRTRAVNFLKAQKTR